MIETAFKSIERNELLENCTDLQRDFPRVSGSRGISEFQQQQYDSRSSEFSSSPLFSPMSDRNLGISEVKTVPASTQVTQVSSPCLSAPGPTKECFLGQGMNLATLL